MDPVEQHVHSLLEVLPVTGAFLLTALHWDQARALTGRGGPDFGVRFKRRDPLSASARVRLLAAVTVFGILPYAEELWRCWRTKPTIRPLPQPAVPATQTLRIPPGSDTPPAGQQHAAPGRRGLMNHSSTPDYEFTSPRASAATRPALADCSGLVALMAVVLA